MISTFELPGTSCLEQGVSQDDHFSHDGGRKDLPPLDRLPPALGNDTVQSVASTLA